MWITPERDRIAITFSLPRDDENVPVKRRPSCRSMVIVKGTLRNSASPACVATWCGLPEPKMMDSLLPFHVPRRSGTSWASTGIDTNAAKATKRTGFRISLISI
jgi:hypothetical protein